MATPERKLTNPKEIGERGEQIYEKKYKDEYEARHKGKFAAIEVYSEQAFVAETPERALDEGRKAVPEGVFHLIRVGSPGAFRVSYTSDANVDWLFQ
ncbi:MAG: hypothetical protein ACE5MH_06275 [Terriglobia bacterium]